jgi:hypothetical protein
VVIVIAVFGFLYFRQGTTTNVTVSTGTNFGSQFNPFGNNNPTTPPVVTPPVNVSGFVPAPVVETPKAQLIKVSSMPVAGYAVFIKERLKDIPIVAPTVPVTPLPVDSTGTQNVVAPVTVPTSTITNTKAVKPTPPPTEFVPALRYVDRATGNIFETFADKIMERKFSTTVIPKVYEAFFANKGSSVVMRYLKGDGKTIQTFVGNLPKELLGGDTTTNNEIKGSFLPDNIEDMSVSADTSSMFYLFNVGDNIVGTTMNFLNNKKVQIFDSPFTEWLSWWPSSKMITLSTKPASGIPGYAYSVDPTNSKNLNKVMGGVDGLTTVTSPSGKLVLYSDSNLSLSVFHTDTKVSDLLGVKTMAEKCVWGSASDVIYCAVPKSIDPVLYPDSWYQGETSFNDQIWKIDIKSGNATMLLDPITLSKGEEIDGIKLALDDGANYLFFVNKKDSFLWEMGLK